jgi:hypothetical protein
MPRVKIEGVFQQVAAQAAPKRASSRLKSRIFSALQLAQQETGPLCSLSETRRAGARLCLFEELVRLAPTAEALKQKNPCRLCHARILAEHLEHAPIYWPGCPYVRFQDR